MTQTPDPVSQKTDDDATAAEPKVEYKSEQHELIGLIEKATGKPPNKKLIADILDRLKLREMSLRASLDDARPRLQRLKRRAGPGFSIPWLRIRAARPRPAPTNGLMSPDARLSAAEKGPYYGPFKNGAEVAAFLRKKQHVARPSKLKKSR